MIDLGDLLGNLRWLLTRLASTVCGKSLPAPQRSLVAANSCPPFSVTVLPLRLVSRTPPRPAWHGPARSLATWCWEILNHRWRYSMIAMRKSLGLGFEVARVRLLLRQACSSCCRAVLAERMASANVHMSQQNLPLRNTPGSIRLQASLRLRHEPAHGVPNSD